MEQIIVEGLEVFGYHGVYEQEKEEGQIFVVNCWIDTSFAGAIHSDDLSNTVDYGNVCLFIKKYFAENAHDLLEKVADELATSIMYAFPGVQKLVLEIKKPHAPIPMEFANVGVKVEKAWHQVALAIGSNMGDKEKYLTDAMEDSMQANRIFASSGVSVSSTSTRAALPNMTAAGKSGTTSNNNDIWFIGYTPYYTAGVWGGCDENQKLTGQNGGTSYHKDIWRNIMNRVHEGLEDPGFTVPDSVETAEICRKSGKRAVSGVCDHDPRGDAVYTEYFAKGTAPTEVCDKHVAVTVCAESGKRSTEYCPTKTTKVCMVLPEGEEDLATDDSVFSIPGYCNIHGRNSTIISPTIEDNDNSGGETTTPTKATVVPVGPGYQPTTAPEWEYTGPGAKH